MHRTQKDKLHLATDKDRKREYAEYETLKYRNDHRTVMARRQMEEHKPYGRDCDAENFI